MRQVLNMGLSQSVKLGVAGRAADAMQQFGGRGKAVAGLLGYQ